MGILNIAWHNFLRRARTRGAGDHVPRPAGFRGEIEHDPALCTGCRTCERVCAPGAISFEPVRDEGIAWKFFSDKCSFCGLCVQYCPTHAIVNRGKPQAVGTEPSSYQVAHTVEYRWCSGCGRPVLPLPQSTLRELYGGALPEMALAQQDLCQECRRRDAGRGLRDAFGPPGGGAR